MGTLIALIFLIVISLLGLWFICYKLFKKVGKKTVDVLSDFVKEMDKD